jgi:hypothetical protein
MQAAVSSCTKNKNLTIRSSRTKSHLESTWSLYDICWVYQVKTYLQDVKNIVSSRYSVSAD